jgi:hypothetical protein
MRLRRNKRCLWFMVYGLWALIAGCGYTAKVILPDNIKTVHVELFQNRIDITKEVSVKDKYEVYRPDFEVDLRDALVNRIFLEGHMKIADKKAADGILEGDIIQYRKDPLRYQNEIVEEYRISLVCNIRLIDSDGQKILLEKKNITGDAVYFTRGNLQKTEAEALNDAMADLSRRIVDGIVENW